MAERTRPFTGSSYVLNDGLEVNRLSPEEIRQEQAGRRRATEARTTVLPHRNEVFADGGRVSGALAILRRQRSREAANRVRQVRYTDRQAGVLRGSAAIDVAVPLVPENEAAVVDDRLPFRARNNVDGNTTVRVGAIEAVVEGYASALADTTAALVLYDARHARNENAILGAAVTTLSANAPMRAVFRTPMRLLLEPSINEHIRCVIISPNTDMGDHAAAMIRVGAVSQVDQGSHEEILTVGQLRAEEYDRAAAALYTSSNCRVIQRHGGPPPISGTFNVPFARSMSTRFTGRGYEECPGPSRQDFTIQLEPRVVEEWRPVRSYSELSQAMARNQNRRAEQEHSGHFSEPVDRTTAQALEPVVIENAITKLDVLGSDVSRTLWTGSFEVPLEVLPGNVLYSFSLATIMSGTGPLARRLSLALECNKKLEVQLTCKLPQNSGLGLAIVYGQYLPTTTTVTLKSVLTLEHYIWNPVMEAYVTYEFNVCSTGAWSPVWAEGMGGNFMIVGVEGWTNPPLASTAVEVRVLLTNETIQPEIYGCKQLPQDITLNRWCGTHTFAQGRHVSPVIVELSLGTPTVYGNGVVETLGASLMSMANCWKGDVVVEVTRLSSTFVGATLTCAVLAGNKVATINKSTVNDVPHVKIVVPTGYTGVTFTVPMELMGWSYSSERKRVDAVARRHRGLCLAMWVVDAVTATDTSSFNMSVEIKAVRNLTTYGYGYGFVNSSSRCQTGADMELVAKPTFNTGWHDWMWTDLENPQSDEDFLQYHFNPAQADASLASEQTTWRRSNSSFMRVLNTSLWWKGRLWFKILWIGSTAVTQANKKGRVSAYVNWAGESSQATYRSSSCEKSGDSIGFIDFYGINNGFQLMAPGLNSVSAWPMLTIKIASVGEYVGARLQIMPDDNFQVSGARVTEGVVIAGVSGATEYGK